MIEICKKTTDCTKERNIIDFLHYNNFFLTDN